MYIISHSRLTCCARSLVSPGKFKPSEKLVPVVSTRSVSRFSSSCHFDAPEGNLFACNWTGSRLSSGPSTAPGPKIPPIPFHDSIPLSAFREPATFLT